MRKHFKPPIEVTVPLIVRTLSPLDHSGIELKIRQRDEIRALYAFVSSFVCMCACMCLFICRARSTSIKENQAFKKRTGKTLKHEALQMRWTA